MSFSVTAVLCNKNPFKGYSKSGFWTFINVQFEKAEGRFAKILLKMGSDHNALVLKKC